MARGPAGFARGQGHYQNGGGGGGPCVRCLPPRPCAASLRT